MSIRDRSFLLQQEMSSLELEAKDLEKDIVGYTEQLEAVAEAIKGFKEQLAQMEESTQKSKVLCLNLISMILLIITTYMIGGSFTG